MKYVRFRRGKKKHLNVMARRAVSLLSKPVRSPFRGRGEQKSDRERVCLSGSRLQTFANSDLIYGRPLRLRAFELIQFRTLFEKEVSTTSV